MAIKQTQVTGDMVENFTYTDEGIVQVQTIQDPTKYIKAAADARDSESITTPAGDMHRYASIPAGVVVEMINKGLNPYDRDNLELLKREIDLNYPYLKTTNRRGW